MSQDITSLPKVRGNYRFNVALSKTNWFRVGGKAQILFTPKDLDDLAFFLKNKDSNLPVIILGVGSNIIIRDGGIEGVVIKLGREFATINHKNNLLTIGGGCLCYNAALYSKIHGLSGLEFMSGIPGGIAGSIKMNAGCYGNDVAGNLIEAVAVDHCGNIQTIKNKDFGFKYRGNNLPSNLIIVQGIFKVTKSTTLKVGAKIAEFTSRRESTQPIRSQTGGSTFKNPANSDKKAWQLIDQSGCRGMKFGNAQISELHCNFMINNGNASASDLINLGNQVIDKVLEETGVKLEWEIKIIGKD